MSKKRLVSTAICLTTVLSLGSMQTAFAATETEAPVDKSMVDTTGFAKADDYINVRSAGYVEGDVVGTLKNNASVYIEEVTDDGWYKIRSGNLEGYVAGYLIATGDEAQGIAQTAGYTTAEVGTDSLNVRTSPGEDGEVVATVGPSDSLEVVEDLGDWVKVCLDADTYGYVSADYVNTKTEYATGETVQEQSEREEAEYIAAEAAYEAEMQAQAAQAAAASAEYVASYGADVEALYQAYLEAQEAAMHPVDETDAEAKADAAVAAYQAYINAANGNGAAAAADTTAAAATDTTTDTTAAATTASSSDIDALYQAYLAAQEAAMHPVDEADAAAKAQAAIDAYNAYIAACGSSETVASVQAAPAETAAAETTTAAAETVQQETPQTDAPQTEAPAATSSSNSLGSKIAAFAQQFVGNPYVYGGSSLTGGADCSGFTMAVMANFGIGLPHNAAAQSGCGTPVSLSDLQPGDLLFYGNGGIGHVTLYIGNGQVVHASNEQTGIKISPYNYRNPVAAVRCW